jgi:hypothetical protein
MSVEVINCRYNSICQQWNFFWLPKPPQTFSNSLPKPFMHLQSIRQKFCHIKLKRQMNITITGKKREILTLRALWISNKLKRFGWNILSM